MTKLRLWDMPILHPLRFAQTGTSALPWHDALPCGAYVYCASFRMEQATGGHVLLGAGDTVPTCIIVQVPPVAGVDVTALVPFQIVDGAQGHFCTLKRLADDPRDTAIGPLWLWRIQLWALGLPP